MIRKYLAFSRNSRLYSNINFVLSLIIFFVILFFMIYFSIRLLICKQVQSHYVKTQNKFSTTISNYLNQEIYRVHQHLIKASLPYNGKEIFEIDSDQFLLNNSNLLSVYNNGIYLFSIDGIVLSELPSQTNRKGQDFSFRPYIKETIIKNKPIISDPYISSKAHGAISIMLTSPIYNKVGQIIAIFGGSINLESENFINEILSLKFHDLPRFILVNREGIVISHQERSYLYGHLNLRDLLSEQTDIKHSKKSSIINVLSYPDWFIVSNPFNEEMNKELLYYYKISCISIIIILLLCMFIILFIYYKSNLYFYSLQDKIKIQNLYSNGFKQIKVKGTYAFQLLQRSLNNLILGFKENYSHNRAIESDIFNLLHHSTSGFVSFRIVDNKVSSYNQLFLKMVNKSKDDIKTEDIYSLLFNNFVLYYKPFETFINGFDEVNNLLESNIINEDSKQIRVTITAFRLRFLEQDQIVLIINNKEQNEELHHQSIISSNLNEIILEKSQEMIHYLDPKGMIKTFNSNFKNNFIAYSKFKENYIWDLLENNKEKLELQQFINGLKTYKEDTKHFIIHLRHIKTQELNLYHLYYYVVLDKYDQKALLVGFLKK